MKRTNGRLHLIHGWGMNRAVWQTILPALARQTTATTIDLPGHGDAAMTSGATGAAAFLSPLREQLPADSRLLGWSLGGLLAMQLALAEPRRYSALILVASNPCFRTREHWPYGMTSTTLDDFSRRLQSDAGATIDAFLNLQFLGSKGGRQALRSLQQALRSRPAPDEIALQTGLDLLSETDLSEQLTRLDIPTLIIQGSHDRIVPPAAAEAMAARLPKARLEIIDGAGHAPFLSHPAPFTRAVLDFIDA